MEERTARPHDFWLETCGVDTYHRSSGHARLDTPWNAFTSRGTALVCTLWTDLIVDVIDPDSGRVRRFIKMGGRSKSWQGVAVQHGREAQANLERAIELKVPVIGYEAEPDRAALERNIRSVKHFYLDRPHQLKGWIGLRLMDLEERLQIEEAFKNRGFGKKSEYSIPPKLFELIDELDETSTDNGEETEGEEDANEVDEISRAFEGNLSTDEYARLALPLLIEHVSQQIDDILVPLTYQRLAELLGRRNRHGVAWARGLGHVLGRVTALIDDASRLLPEKPPYLTSVVVLSNGPDVGLPDRGVSGRWPGYQTLSREDKRAKVNLEYQRILQFGSRWNEVLQLAGLRRASFNEEDEIHTSRGGWGGGESEDHKALKHFVHDHPELFGAASDWFAQEEFALRSGDEVDVVFKSEHVWIGVEVKSKISDRLLSDYERGLYQVVKYRSVLEAQALVDHPTNTPEVRVMLALQSKLPRTLRDLALKLKVAVLERVGQQ